MKPLVVIGDALLDRDVVGSVERLCPDAPAPVLDEQEQRTRPGGAALAAALAAGDGREVTLIAALGNDPAGSELRRLLQARGVQTVDLGLSGATPEKIRLRSNGRSLLRLDRGGAPARVGRLSAAARAAIGWAEAILVSDYGRGMTAQPAIRTALEQAAGEKPLVWDPHVRGARPVAGAELASPNEAEVEKFVHGDAGLKAGAGAGLVEAPVGDLRGSAVGDLPAGAAEALPAGTLARRLAEEWDVRMVCVTCGARGAVACEPGGDPHPVHATAVSGGDTCGAGDRFSSAAAGALADGAGPLEAVRRAVEQACAFVAAGAAGGLACSTQPARPRVVATGGCFDLLHTGHVHTLRAARALGDRLIVCLNSDASVRRLKGPSRPVVPQSDRAAVLGALECVEEVVIFEEDTPLRVVERLRPDIWAKGGDYLAHQLPEAPVVARWGGRVVTLPYIDGHSTTRLLKEVACRDAG